MKGPAGINTPQPDIHRSYKIAGLTINSIPESRIRLSGYLMLTSFFFLFFMLEIAFSWQGDNILLKIIGLTVCYTLLMWEPTRLLILYLRKKIPGQHLIQHRIKVLICLAVPYAFLLGFLRIYLEDKTNFWGTPVVSWGSYSYTIGITLLFILLQIAIYEGISFVFDWNKTIVETEEIKRLSIQVRLDALRLQIQPHFLFNSLNTLIGLIELNPKGAAEFTQSLAAVYRYLLEASQQPLVSLADELRFTQEYWSLLKLRHPDGLNLMLEAARAGEYEVPPLCLQVLVENAVKHNIITKAKPLNVDIFLDRVRHEVVVQNNYQPKPSPGSHGLGLQNLNKKLELLNLPGLHIDTSGGTFTVTFPVIKK